MNIKSVSSAIIKRFIASLIMICMLTVCLGMNEAPDEENAINNSSDLGDPEPVTTNHQITIEDKKISYTITAGMMPVTVDGNLCSIFYTAYTLDNVKSMAERPITFSFNGGPGSSSEWLHLGMLGPKRVELDENGQPTRLQGNITDNENSILDITDLVFIDPVGTGYSHVADGVDEAFFSNYNNDLSSVGEFIRLYTSQNNRWGSPKYLAGESYGTMRAVGLADYLSTNYEMGLNGLILISNLSDFYVMNEVTGSDLSYVLIFPSYAATAHYHKLLDEKYQSMDISEFVKEARSFAEGEYQTALFKGNRLSESEKKAIAIKIAGFTGLNQDYILKCNLRVFLEDFCMNVLSDKNLMTGRLDSRFTGPLIGKNANDFIDPSDSTLNASFSSAINQYISEELGYKTERTYKTINLSVNGNWTFNLDNSTIDQKGTVSTIMSTNKYLKIWVLCGYYDLATPFFSAEWIYDHVPLEKETRKNLSFTYYPSGHMIYLHEPSLKQFREDAKKWYEQ